MKNKKIQVWADWFGLDGPILMGELNANENRGKEIFSFEYNGKWLDQRSSFSIDPDLKFYAGPQFSSVSQDNFGIFLDSSPDRWGRVLMRRRELQIAKQTNKKVKTLMESDYLLGVYDEHRIGGIRFKLSDTGPFLDDNKFLAAPPWTAIRDLEHASLQLEKDDAENNPDYGKWLQMLVAPGASLGGARPKASVLDNDSNLWIAKFPSLNDQENRGAWEAVAYRLAEKCGIHVSKYQAKIFSGKHHTFLNKRFDRYAKRQRIHFASAMTVLGYKDGDDHSSGVSYLQLAEFIQTYGARPTEDLKQLWRRIVFNICISNVDDHLRNHGFLLENNSWVLSPAYDMNPSEISNGLKLNISEDDNSQDIDLALMVAPSFRIQTAEAKKISREICTAVKKWRSVAIEFNLSKAEQNRMSEAFRKAEAL